MYRFLSILFLLFSSFGIYGQLATQVRTATDVVQNVLLGDPNITVTNINYQGSPKALGSFTSTNTNLGLNTGIVMTTGTIENTFGLGVPQGPHGPNNVPDGGVDNGYGGYPLLTTIVGRQTFNASVLSFDFSTCSDSIEFRYVFGSEEYPEYVGSQFNDVFGFFISGPGFNGQQNIARLPNGSIVAINTVNNGNNQPAPGVNPAPATNPQYFVWNGNGSQAPYNLSNMYIQYDGFTKVLTAKAKIQCNETYRLTLAIADVGDGILDSGIFLEAKSFKANDPIKISHTVSSQLYDSPNILSEPCTEVTLRFERTACNLNTPVNIQVVKTGSATNGIDYTNIPNTITLPAGQQVYEYRFSTINDNIPEGDETLNLLFKYVDNCGDQREKNIDFIIRDLTPIDLELEANDMKCPGDKVIIRPRLSNTNSRLIYEWSTGETSQTITVSPTQNTTYTLRLKDECNNLLAIANYTVVFPDALPLEIILPPDIVEICPFMDHTIEGESTGGYGGESYSWYNENNQAISRTNTANIRPEFSTIFIFEAKDQCGMIARDTLNYTVTSPPLIVDFPPFPEICPGDSIELTSIVTGGYGQYYYLWPHSGETTPSVWVNPLVTTSYPLEVSDECQTFVKKKSATVTVIKPTADFTIAGPAPLFNNLPVQFENLTQNGVTYFWDFGNTQTSTDVHPQIVYQEPGAYTIHLTAWDQKGCVDSTYRWTVIIEEHYIYVPNTFTPDNGRSNNVFKASTVNVSNLNIVIYNRWGELVFESDDVLFEWDGSYKGEVVPDGTYSYKIKYLARSGWEETITGHVNVLR